LGHVVVDHFEGLWGVFDKHFPDVVGSHFDFANRIVLDDVQNREGPGSLCVDVVPGFGSIFVLHDLDQISHEDCRGITLDVVAGEHAFVEWL
jgi:hypothetical protein